MDSGTIAIIVVVGFVIFLIGLLIFEFIRSLCEDFKGTIFASVIIVFGALFGCEACSRIDDDPNKHSPLYSFGINSLLYTTFSQLSSEDGINSLVYKGNRLFSGTAWSNDGKFIRVRIENGRTIDCHIYDYDGNLVAHINPNSSNKHQCNIYNAQKELVYVGVRSSKNGKTTMTWYDKDNNLVNHKLVEDSTIGVLLNDARTILKEIKQKNNENKLVSNHTIEHIENDKTQINTSKKAELLKDYHPVKATMIDKEGEFTTSSFKYVDIKVADFGDYVKVFAGGAECILKPGKDGVVYSYIDSNNGRTVKFVAYRDSSNRTIYLVKSYAKMVNPDATIVVDYKP